MGYSRGCQVHPVGSGLPFPPGQAEWVQMGFSYVEPTIELDLYADKPFALSPALASMNYVSFSRDAQTSSPGLVKEDSLSMLKELYTGGKRISRRL